jgi:signal transduction histidine kinase
MQRQSESPANTSPRTILRGIDPWVATATTVVALALLGGLADALFSADGDHARLAVILGIGAVGLLCALRDNILAAVAAALLVAAEVGDPAPRGTWAVAGGLLFLLALRRPRLDAVAAGVLFAVAGVLADIPWSHGVLDGGVFGLITLAAAMVGVGQWVQAQRRYVVAEIGRRQEETERRRQEVTRHVAEERLRIARDLHDSVAHHFAVVSIQTNLARAQLATSPPAADRALQTVQTAARSALEELQLLLGVLRDEPEAAPLLPDVQVERLHDLVARYRQTGLDVESSGTEVFGRLSSTARAAVYRVLQEALTNAHRYGDGSAGVRFTAADQHVELEVRNAIRPSAVAAASGGGRGLAGMRERIGDLGGSLHAGADDRCFVVRARVPVAASVVAGAPDEERVP